MVNAASALGQDKAKQRIRALDLIQKHGGSNAREGQKTKWIVDLVMKIDEQYKAGITEQQQQIAQLEQQLQDLQVKSSSTVQQLQDQVATLQAKVKAQAISLYSTEYALETAKTQYAGMQESLRCAEDAASVAAVECASLAAAVQAMTEQEARVRCCQAHRAHQLKESLLQTNAALRQAKAQDRKANDEREWRLRDREQSLAAERADLLNQQALHQARDEALEALQLKHHLTVCKIKDLLRGASQQADSVAAVIASSGATKQAPDADIPVARRFGQQTKARKQLQADVVNVGRPPSSSPGPADAPRSDVKIIG